jgi:hypothetical protein
MKDKIIIHEMKDPYSGADFFDIEPEKRKINLFKISNIVFDDVHYEDFPDFCDAFISSADMDDIPMTEDELEELNENHREFVWEKLFDKLF